MKKREMFTIFNIVLIAVLILIIIHWSTVIQGISIVWSVIFPLVLGGMIAFVMNLLMTRFERVLYPKVDSRIANASRRPLAIFLSFLTVILVLSLIIMLVIPQLVSAVMTLIEVIPQVAETIEAWVQKEEQLIPFIADLFDEVNWQEALSGFASIGNTIVQRIASSSMSFLTTSVGAITNIVLAIMFSLYILMSKEKLGRQFKDIVYAYFPYEIRNIILNTITMANHIFAKFISGMVFEALILGTLVTIGLLILRIPYATMLGVLQGTLAFIPIFGAFISGAVGVIILLSVSPAQAIIFLIFVIIVQQLEGDFIYPRIVGDAIGLPGIWVLFAVTVGGGLIGIPGMLLGVPFAATIYKLITIDVRYRKNFKHELIEEENIDQIDQEIKILAPLRIKKLNREEIKALQD